MIDITDVRRSLARVAQGLGDIQDARLLSISLKGLMVEAKRKTITVDQLTELADILSAADGHIPSGSTDKAAIERGHDIVQQVLGIDAKDVYGQDEETNTMERTTCCNKGRMALRLAIAGQLLLYAIEDAGGWQAADPIHAERIASAMRNLASIIDEYAAIQPEEI